MSKAFYKKPTYLTNDDVAVLKKARAIFKKINRNMVKMNKRADYLDEHKDEDIGGEEWKKNRTSVYDDLDYLYHNLSIDAYKFPKFVEGK